MADRPYPIRGLGDWWNELRQYINDRPTKTEVKSLISRRTPGGEALGSILDTKNGVVNLTVLGDSTGNDSFEWVVRSLSMLAVKYPDLHIERNLWSDATKTYTSNTVVNAGSGYVPPTPASTQTTFNDTFDRTGELNGSTANTGGTWTATAGGWTVGSGVAARTSETSAIAGPTVAGPQGDVTLNLKGVTLSTVPAAAAKTVSAFIKGAARGAGLELRVTVNTSGSATWSLIYNSTVLHNGGYTLDSVLPPNTAGNVVDIQVSLTGNVYKAKIGTQEFSYTLDSSVYDAVKNNGFTAMNSSAGFSGSLSVSQFEVITNVPALPARGRGLLVNNGSMPGSTLAYQTTNLEAMVPSNTDVILISSSHNYATTTPEGYIDAVKAFVVLAKARAPKAKIIVSSQNPEFVGTWPESYNQAHLDRLRALRITAAGEGWGYVPVVESFLALPDKGRSKIDADGIHPNAEGGTFWAEAFIAWTVSNTDTV